jgi:glycerate kinase
MFITIAPDSFKDCLPAKEVAHYLAKGIRNVMPDADIFEIPMADGGEGTVDALVAAKNGKLINQTVKDPLMRDINASFGMLDERTAIIEMAAASGLERLAPHERNPLLTTTYGTGQLIHAAIREGAWDIIVGLGGSATNDGGAGMAQALGARLTDKKGRELPPGGIYLKNLAAIDAEVLKQTIKNVNIYVAVDVSNPLLGKNGASYVFAKQKGADEEMIKGLDKALEHYINIVESKFQRPVRDIPGAGAAGGLAAGMLAFLNARLSTGFQLVSELTHLETYIRQSDVVITAEGRIDYQTRFGKTPFGVAQLARKYHKPVFGFAGGLGKDYEVLQQEGFTALYPIVEMPVSLKFAIQNAPELLEKAASRMMLTFVAGRHANP